MFNKHDIKRDECMLTGSFAKKGYDWWWHSFTGISEKTGEERPFFIEYFVCNPALGEKEPVLGQLPANKAAGKRPSYLMVKAGWWGEGKKQLHRFFSWDDVNLRYKAPFSVEAADCYASETVLKGSVNVSEEDAKRPELMCDAGSMEWDLRIDKEIAFNVGYGASTPLRAIKAFEMYWHAEGMKSSYIGTITANGEKYNIIPEKSFGYADKNWGSGFTSPWVWLSSNELTSNLTGKKLENSVFDIGGGKPKIYFLPLDRKLLSAFWYEGEAFEFNFSKLWTLCKTDFNFRQTEDEVFWYVRQETTKAVMELHGRCSKKDMLLVNYEAPDGSKRHNCLWNGGNGTADIQLYRKKRGALELIDDIHATHMGCEYGEYDR